MSNWKQLKVIPMQIPEHMNPKKPRNGLEAQKIVKQWCLELSHEFNGGSERLVKLRRKH